MGKVSNDQFREFFGKLLVSCKDEIVAMIDEKKLQEIVNKLNSKEAKNFAENLVRFINNGFNLQIIGNHEIDTHGTPNLPFDGATIEEHKKSGKMILDFSKINFYLSEAQKTGSIVGRNLRKELKGKKVFNACVLDYLLANPHIISEDWKRKVIFFWGTIFRSTDGYLCVRCLVWDGGEWRSDYNWLGNRFNGYNPAAVSAS